MLRKKVKKTNKERKTGRARQGCRQTFAAVKLETMRLFLPIAPDFDSRSGGTGIALICGLTFPPFHVSGRMLQTR